MQAQCKTSSGRTCGSKERDWDTAPNSLLPHLAAACRGGGYLQGGERLGEEKQMSRDYIHFFCLCLPPSALLAAKEGLLALERTQLPFQLQHMREKILGGWKLSLLFKLVLFSASLRDN